MPKIKKYKKKSRNQKFYKMKGCSNKTRKNKNLGGSHINPDIKNAYPNPGPPSYGFNFLNPQTGGCGDQCSVHMKGGSNYTGGQCEQCGIHLNGGSGCGCNKNMKGGNNSLPYPNGLLGNAWTPSVTGWPGVDGISMNRNHLGYNTYANDVSRQMRDVGAAPPYTYLKGGKKSKTKKNKTRSKQNKKGGNSTNFISQDLINLGRQFQYGLGSTYNAMRGYAAPVNPLPWKDQLTK